MFGSKRPDYISEPIKLSDQQGGTVDLDRIARLSASFIKTVMEETGGPSEGLAVFLVSIDAIEAFFQNRGYSDELCTEVREQAEQVARRFKVGVADGDNIGRT